MRFNAYILFLVSIFCIPSYNFVRYVSQYQYIRLESVSNVIFIVFSLNSLFYMWYRKSVLSDSWKMLQIASILYVECLYIAYILVNRPGVSRMRSLTLKIPIKMSKSAFYRGVLNATLSPFGSLPMHRCWVVEE